MPISIRKHRWTKILLTAGVFFAAVFLLFVIAANRLVEPMVRDRLHTLIISGSDSLYQYKLGSLKTNFFGGNVELANLRLWVDSNHYHKLEAKDGLPSLVMQLHLERGYVKGLGVFNLLFGREIEINEIFSHKADIKLTRNVHEDHHEGHTTPLWKSIQPAIKNISIRRIHLDGVKLLYKNADTTNAAKLQFDRCEALFQDVRIDSASAADVSRIAFTKNILLHFEDLKFRTPDSTYKMKAKDIRYSTAQRSLEIHKFKLQPTLEREDFYKNTAFQESMYYVEFDKIRFTNLHLDQFIHKDLLMADSVIINKPDVTIFNDKTLPKEFEYKIGKYPHQQLLRSKTTIRVKGLRIQEADLEYIEKSGKTLKEGTLAFSDMNAEFSNVTNDATWIRKNGKCEASIQALVFKTSPINANFIFHLDSLDGEFDVSGQVQNLTAAQLNQVAVPLSNAQFQSLDIQFLRFQVHGDNYSTSSNVQMHYNNLMVILRKRDDETGEVKTKKFLTKLLNKYTLWSSNPESGIERKAENVLFARLATKAFFGVIWKSIYRGMQDVMMKSGHYET